MTGQLIVTPVEMADLAQVAELEQRVSQAFVYPTLTPAGQMALRESQSLYLQDILDTEHYQALKVSDAQHLVGIIAVRDGDYVAKLFVDADYQGQGIGSMLLNEICLQKSPGTTLQVRSSLNAVGFYEAYGFHATGPETEVNNIRFLPMAYTLA